MPRKKKHLEIGSSRSPGDPRRNFEHPGSGARGSGPGGPGLGARGPGAGARGPGPGARGTGSGARGPRPGARDLLCSSGPGHVSQEART